MLTFELVHKKRRPIKVYAIAGLVIGFIVIILIGLLHRRISNSLGKVLWYFNTVLLVASLFVLLSSFRFRKVIGRITFSRESIEVEFYGKKEIFRIEDIHDISFDLRGYEGLNKTITSQGFYDLVARSGINNFVQFNAGNDIKKLEFYIPDQKAYNELQVIKDYYQHIVKSIE
jgi:hypothetical protein